MCSADIFLGLLAILFPPLAVWVKCGICSADSVINILLCVLGYIPGLLHAWYIIAKFPEDDVYQRVPQESEDGRVTYVFVHGDPPHGQGRQGRSQPKPQPQPGMNYGSTGSNGNASSSTTAAQAGSSSGGDAPAPPTYAEAVKGDNKVQT